MKKNLNLYQIDDSEILQNWINSIQNYSISENENWIITLLQSKLQYRVDDWNEQELIEHFVAPLFSIVNFNTKEYGMFSERFFKGLIEGIEFYGYPDAIVAKGRRRPEIPYFCFTEYKKEKENSGDPKGQCLAVMLVAQELNENKFPIYGVVVKGKIWEFLVLQGKEYAISNAYKATDEELFEIVKLLKHLKTIIDEYVKS